MRTIPAPFAESTRSFVAVTSPRSLARAYMLLEQDLERAESQPWVRRFSLSIDYFHRCPRLVGIEDLQGCKGNRNHAPSPHLDSKTEREMNDPS